MVDMKLLPISIAVSPMINGVMSPPRAYINCWIILWSHNPQNGS